MMTWIQPDWDGQPGTRETATKLEALGFENWHTGGGCWCSAKTFDGSTMQIVITSTDGCGIPTSDDWSVAVYTDESWQPDVMILDKCNGDGPDLLATVSMAEALVDQRKGEFPDSFEDDPPIRGDEVPAGKTVMDLIMECFPKSEVSAEDMATFSSMPLNSSCGDDCKGVIEGGAALLRGIVNAQGEKASEIAAVWVLRHVELACSVMIRG